MATWDDYIGIPFKPDGRDRTGTDCWGLVHLIYRERLGIGLPEHSGIYTGNSLSSLKKVAREMEEARKRWLLVEAPQEYDAVLLRTGKYVWHVGMVIDNRRMIHIMDGINSVIEPYTGLAWKNRVQEFRRYVR